MPSDQESSMSISSLRQHHQPKLIDQIGNLDIKNTDIVETRRLLPKIEIKNKKQETMKVFVNTDATQSRKDSHDVSLSGV